jgi:DoxX-like family
MTTKTSNILYWVFTILFGGLMIFSSVGGIQPTDQTIEIIHKGMGFPIPFIQFISWAKIIGALAILTPRLPKTIKEWAYAGLFFDLTGAVFSIVAAFGFNAGMLGMLLWFATGILSYYFWTKKEKSY